MSKAFREGKRDFKPDEIVYAVIEDTEYRYDKIEIGKITGYYGYDVYFIKLYTMVRNPDYKVTYDNDESIKRAINDGCFIPRDSVENWRKLHPNIPTDTRLHKEKLFHTSNEALDEINKRKQIAEERKERHSHMTEEEIFMEEDIDYLRKCGLSESEIKEYVSLVKTTDYLPEIYDLLIRKIDDEVQWKDKSGWKTLMKLDRPKVKVAHPEKYYVNVYHTWDADEEPVLRGYTDESPESIFQKYGDPTEYVMIIANKQWKIENALEVPIRYTNEVTRGKDNELVPILVTHYQTEKGTFEIANGKLRHFDISIDSKHSINQFWISVLSNTSLNDQEVREWFSKRIEKITGKFSGLFKEEIEKLEIRKDFGKVK